MSPGQGFWLESTSSQDVFLAGEVVLDEARQILLYPSLNLVGFPYSSAMRLDETELWSLATNGNALLGPLNTNAAPEEPALARGYWLNVTSEECVVWTEVRPYEDVFPTNDEPPAILGIEVLPGAAGVVLSVSCAGIPQASLDVLYQDLSLTSRFETTSGWKMAGDAVPADGQDTVQWTDTGSTNRLPPGEVPGRYYLIGRADLDLNGNGVPDAREQFVYGMRADAEVSFATGASGGSGSSPTGATDLWTEPTNVLNEITDTNEFRQPPAVVLGRVIYVDQKLGDDALSGRGVVVVGTDGPKKTIRAGLRAVGNGGMLVLRGGQYGESLNVAGRSVTVRVEGRVDLSGDKGMVPPPVNGGINPPPESGSVTNF